MLEPVLALVRQGPVGVLAAASAEPARDRAPSTSALLGRLGVQAVDLGITIDNVDYAAQDEDLLETIAGLRGILLCGGNQIRLVETLLHRGEESAVLRAIARAHSRGRGADRRERRRLGALGGDDRRRLVLGGAALRRLVGHRPPRARHPGGDRAVRRRHRRPEPDRSNRGSGGWSSPAPRRASASGSASSRTAPRRRPRPAPGSRRPDGTGFVLVEIDPATLVLQGDSFVAENVRLTVRRAGRRRRPAGRDDRARRAAEASAALLGDADRRARARGGRAPAPRRRRRLGDDPRADAAGPRAARRVGGARPRMPARPERLSVPVAGWRRQRATVR